MLTRNLGGFLFLLKINILNVQLFVRVLVYLVGGGGGVMQKMLFKQSYVEKAKSKDDDDSENASSPKAVNNY